MEEKKEKKDFEYIEKVGIYIVSNDMIQYSKLCNRFNY